MSTALTGSKIMYLPSLSIFPNFLDIYIACYSHRLAVCWCIAERLCQVLHPTICLIRYLIRHINFPQFREYLHYWMTGFCVNFYISSIFFNIPTPCSNQFYNWLFWNANEFKIMWIWWFMSILFEGHWFFFYLFSIAHFLKYNSSINLG